MAHYNDLPVFKVTYDLLQNLYKYCNNLPRDIRHTLLEDLKKDLLHMLELYYKANSTTDKLPFLEEARETIVRVKIRLRLLMDLRHISIKLFAALSDQVEIVSKQLASWQKYVVSKAAAQA